ncbi:hypothetical protein MASR2M15_18300 [Anaerolineales bacterium]
MRKVLIAIALIVIVALGIGIFWVATSGNSEATRDVTAENVTGVGQTYEIDGQASEARFIITEDLRGVPTTVIGKTNDIAGIILINLADPAASELGTIEISARTLVTDNNFRNTALRRDILQSGNDDFEFIRFEATEITGLPETVALGDEVSFQVSGNLIIKNISQPATFDVTLTVAEESLIGSATTTVNRNDYEITIPNAPGVANVAETVDLELDFVAPKQTSNATGS